MEGEVNVGVQDSTRGLEEDFGGCSKTLGDTWARLRRLRLTSILTSILKSRERTWCVVMVTMVVIVLSRTLQGHTDNLPSLYARDNVVLWDLQEDVLKRENDMNGNLSERWTDAANNTVEKRALRYVIEEPDLCRRYSDLEIISYVHSSPAMKQNRQLIRNTWGNLRYYQYIRMRVIFVFGAAKSADEQKKISEESDTYRDIIQLDFVDSYKNLSYKGVGALQWISEHCMHARWILKSDDDIVINVFSLVAFLKYYAAWETSANGAPPSKLLCAVWWGMPVLRGTGCAKWCVSMDEFPNSTFPTYCSGCAFVIPTYLAPRLYNAFFRVRFLWVDDAFISGVMAKAAGISHQPLHSLYELNHHLIEKNMIYGNRLFCHHPGAAGARAKWWPRIVLKETRHLPNSSEEVYS
ncbi:hypothetical protein OTU49_000015 [Cherax quadricarinatus]|uniref:Hexosyltransferase n=1 Tax=Cherax quadricarinatus TaxID=27406 RepID=A0AAW0YNT8_CHEQU